MAIKINTIQAQQGLDIGRQPAVRADTSIYTAGRSVGNALSGLGNQFGAIADQRLKLDNERQAFAAGIADDERRQALATELDNSRKNMPVGGAGFHDTFMKRADEINNEYLKKIETIKPELAARYREKIRVESETWSRNAGNIEYKVGKDFTNGKLNDIAQTHMNAIANNPDPTVTDAMKQAFRDRIENAPYLSPAEKATVIRQVELQYLTTEAAKRFKTADDARRAFGMGESGSFNGLAARQAIANIESSGGNYSAIGPVTKRGDRAYGKYQVMGNNIPSWTREVFGKSMTKEQFLADPKAQDAVFDHFFGKLVKRYGNVADAASIWFTGKPASQSAGKSDGITSAPDYIRRFVNDYKKLASGSHDVKSGGDPRYAGIPLATREKIIRQVTSFEHGEMAKLRAQVGRLSQDANTAFLAGRTDFTGAPTQDMYVRAYGPEEGARRFKIQEDNRAVGENVQQFKTLPAADINQIVKDAATSPAGPGYAVKRQQAAVLARAAKAVLDARNADPAQYAASNNPAVNEAYAAMVKSGDDPQAMQHYADVSIAEQKRLGIAEPSLLPKSYVSAVASDLTNDIAKGNHDAAAQKIQGMQAAWGDHWSTVFAQIAKQGDLSGPLMVVGTMNRPDQAPSARLLMDAVANQKEIVKTIDADAKKAADAAVFDAVKPFMDTLNLPNNSKVISSFQNAVKLLSYQYVRAGESGDAAVKKAYEDIIGKRYVFAGTYRIPVEDAFHNTMEPGNIEDGLRNIKSNIKQFAIMAAPSLVPGMTEKARADATYKHLASFGRWQTLPDESGVVLLDGSGAPVKMVDGSPFTVSWEDARQAVDIKTPEQIATMQKFSEFETRRRNFQIKLQSLHEK